MLFIYKRYRKLLNRAHVSVEPFFYLFVIIKIPYKKQYTLWLKEHTTIRIDEQFVIQMSFIVKPCQLLVTHNYSQSHDLEIF